MRQGWCTHYTGLLSRAGEPREGRRCKAGVLYDDVKRLPVPGRGYQLPCIGDPDTECASYVAVTAEQEAENERVAIERLQQHSATVNAGYCPHCGNAMTKRLVGRCSYAMPCGHRLNAIPSVIHTPPGAIA